MGNSSPARASCADTAPPPPPLTAAPPTIETTPTEAGPGNPGSFEELGKAVKEQCFPQLFDGCKVVMQKGLSKHFQTMHTLTLGSSSLPAQWQFGATYVGTKKLAENDFRPVVIGDISSNGSFTAMFLHQLGQNWKLKVNAQTQQSRWVGYQGSLDYVGSDFTAGLTVANPDLIAGSAVLVAQYFQALTSRVSLGTELLYQRASGMQTALLSVGGSYKTPDWEASARLGVHAWYLSYSHRIKDLTLVADCEGSLMQGETTAGLGYKLDVGSLTMRGRIDSHGKVGAVLEKRLDPLPAMLMLSGQLNHWTDESRFGLALMVG